MARGVADTEMIRRQNRELILGVLRRSGPLSRSEIAIETGLSNATLTTIAAEFVTQGVLIDLDAPAEEAKARGRPSVKLTHNRKAGYILLIELDVTRCRLSLLDYGGVLVDRVESAVTPSTFAESPAPHYLAERIQLIYTRNTELADRLYTVAISVQGILYPDGSGMKWSPIAHFAGLDIVSPLQARFPITVKLYKRGRLMADGMRWLEPELTHKTVATVFIGSTVGMGLTFPDADRFDSDIGTEFGHMIHIPDGALCRCGAHGCIEAYAADYGILRSAYSVPARTPPAHAVPPGDFQQIITQARLGDRNALHAFNLAGSAIGYGLNRLMSIFEIGRIIILGPGTAAYDLMLSSLREGATSSLMGGINGLPPVTLVADASEPVYRGLLMKALTELDRNVFAAMNQQAQSVAE
ncbi:ROK family protein [Pelagibacterium limicola]|uniref:ROK family protein n=1 Tax=Pelagibacterium limicola TaxID=2791022 RepID=UPI0018AFE9E1|nr:ROK family protein [Pelagibacterium limicola]